MIINLFILVQLIVSKESMMNKKIDVGSKEERIQIENSFETGTFSETYIAVILCCFSKQN